MEDHQRIDISKRVNLGGQLALLPLRRPHAAPIVNRLFEFGKSQVHNRSLPALGSEAEPQLIRNGDYEAWPQVTDESQCRQGRRDQAQQARAQTGLHGVWGERVTGASLNGRLRAQAARPSAMVIIHTVS